MSEESTTKSAPIRLRASTRIGYGSGIMANNILASTVQTLALPIYSIALGLNPAWVGLALAIPRFWDAVTDPVMGHISDHTRTRYGRRRPYIITGAIMAGFFYAILWMPPSGLTGFWLAVYFGVVSTLLYTAYTVFIVPYFALGNELTADPDERTRLMSTRVFFIGVPGLLLPWAYKACFLPVFGTNEVEGVRAVGMIAAAMVVVIGCLPGLTCRSSLQKDSVSNSSFWAGLKDSFTNRPFLLVAMGKAAALLSLYVVMSAAPFIGLYHVFAGDRPANAGLLGLLGMTWAIMTMVGSLFFPGITRRLGRRVTVCLGISIMMAGALLTWWTFNPSQPYLALISYMMMSFGIGSVWVTAYAQLADICDVDALGSGMRREGIYSAVFGFIEKVTASIGVAVAGFLVAASGIPSGSEAVNAPVDAILRLRILFAGVPLVFGSIAILAFALYPLTEARMSALFPERKKGR